MNGVGVQETHQDRLFAKRYGKGFAVGSCVFAPKRRGTSAPHYGLAEITGFQICAGTATVAFLNADPGVDDEAVPLHTLIQCPLGVLSQKNEASPRTFCSLAERVMGLNAQDGPKSLSRECALRDGLLCHSDQDSDSGESCAGEQPSKAISLVRIDLENSESHNEEFDSIESYGWRVLCAKHLPSENVDRFYARCFRTAYLKISMNLVPDHQHIVFCIFETYGKLRRFDTFMSLRGHRVHVLNGVRSKFRSVDIISHVLWLCLLAEDIMDKEDTDHLIRNWVPLLEEKPPAAVSVVEFLEGAGVLVTKEVISPNALLIDKESVAVRVATNIQIALGCPAFELMLQCRLSCSDDVDEVIPPSLASIHQQTLENPHKIEKKIQSTHTTLLELCVPASMWQLDLMRALRCHDIATVRDSTCEPKTIPSSLSLLECVANGDVFGDSLAVGLSSSSEGAQLLWKLKSKILFSSDASFFGEEVFPVFAAARAAMSDVFCNEQSENRTDWDEKRQAQRRVALVLPGTGDVHATVNDGSAVFRHFLRRFFSPWHLYVLAPKDGTRPTAEAILESVSWLETGGVLLLTVGETLCSFSALYEEADMVITCGKVAAQWAERNVNALRLSLISVLELEDGGLSARAPWQRSGKKAKFSDVENGIIKEAVTTDGGASGRRGVDTPPVMAKATALLRQLTETPFGKNTVSLRKRHREEVGEWSELCRFARRLVQWSCRTLPLLTRNN